MSFLLCNKNEQPAYKVVRKTPIYGSVILESKKMTGKCATTTLPEGAAFWNARGTSGDTIYYHNKDMSFIDFWKEATDQTLYSIGNKCANVNCTNHNYKLEGAHIVLEKPTGNVKIEERLGIVPLCPKCNNAENKDEMILRYNVKVPIVVWKEVKK